MGKEFNQFAGIWEVYMQEPEKVTETLYGAGIADLMLLKHEVALCYGRTPDLALSNANFISKAPDMFKMLQEAKSMLGKLRRSMTAHPDCTPDSEFDLFADSAQEMEDEIDKLLKEATTI